MLAGFTVLLVCQLAGEVVVQALGLPIPGPVVGLVVLLALLSAATQAPPVEGAADGLLSNLSLLFVPAGVGVMQQLTVLRDEWLPALTALVASTLASLLVTALVFKRLRRDA